jgi:hypothetical protein
MALHSISRQIAWGFSLPILPSSVPETSALRLGSSCWCLLYAIPLSMDAWSSWRQTHGTGRGHEDGGQIVATSGLMACVNLDGSHWAIQSAPQGSQTASAQVYALPIVDCAISISPPINGEMIMILLKCAQNSSRHIVSVQYMLVVRRLVEIFDICVHSFNN